MAISVASASTGMITPASFSTGLTNLENRTVERKVADFSALAYESGQGATLKAVSAGEQILNKLDKLESLLLHADMDATVRGTDQARFVKQSEIAVVLREIDQIVSQAGFDDINLISSESPIYQLQTSRTGGSLRFTPRPMDTKGLALQDVSIRALDRRGLGLENLGMISDTDHAKATELVNTAIKVASNHVDDLKQLQELFTDESLLTKINTVIQARDSGQGQDSSGRLSIGPGLFFDITA